MTVTLTPEQEALVEASIRDGRFASEVDAVAAAFESLRELRIGSPEMADHLRKVRQKNLYDLFRESPFVASGIELDRDKAPWREVDFE